MRKRQREKEREKVIRGAEIGKQGHDDKEQTLRINWKVNSVTNYIKYDCKFKKNKNLKVEDY